MPIIENRSSPAIESSHRNVRVKVEFLKLFEMDTVNKKFTAEVLIESQWNDFNVNIAGESNHNPHWCHHAKSSEYDLNKHWNPRLYIKNLASEPREQLKYKVHKENNIVTITEIKIVKAQFFEKIHLMNFPYDIQELSIVLSSRLNANQINLITDSNCYSLINTELKRFFNEENKWKIFSISKLTNTSANKKIPKKGCVVDFNLKAQPKQAVSLIGTIFCTKKSSSCLFEAFFLTFLIALCSLTVFAINYSLIYSRLQILFTILICSVLFKWLCHLWMPSELSESNLLDKYSSVLIVFVCLQSCWICFANVYSASWLSQADSYALIGFAFLFLIINLICILNYLIKTRRVRQIKGEEKRFLAAFKKRSNKKNDYEDYENEERF